MLTDIKKQEEILANERKRQIITAARAYADGVVGISGLCRKFNITGNTLSNWFCEAISKGYITKESTCNSIMERHVAEYESTFHIKDSSLRQMYKDAINNRSKTGQHNIVSSTVV